jgi:hypothetical protein
MKILKSGMEAFAPHHSESRVERVQANNDDLKDICGVCDKFHRHSRVSARSIQAERGRNNRTEKRSADGKPLEDWFVRCRECARCSAMS